MSACNPYDAATFRDTCGGMLLPGAVGVPWNPYWPDAWLAPLLDPAEPPAMTLQAPEAPWREWPLHLADPWPTVRWDDEQALEHADTGDVMALSVVGFASHGESVVVAPIPEPALSALVATALILAGWRRRWRDDR